MPNFPVPPDLQDMINWCNQPAPQFAGDTHALHFFLFVTTGIASFSITYHGFLFFRPPVPAKRRAAHFEGSGHLIYSMSLFEEIKAHPEAQPPEWVRIGVGLPPMSIDGAVSFLDSSGDSLPGTLLFTSEGDLDVKGSSRFDIGALEFNITKTTVIL